MNSSFQDGYDFFVEFSGSQKGAIVGQAYVDNVNDSIKELADNLNAFSGFKTSASFLKGDIAEFWHASTFNTSSVANDSVNRAFVDRSHDYASADITTNFGKLYGAKYYKDGSASAREQAKSIFEKFNEYKNNGGKENIEEYLKKRNLEGTLSEAIYTGQERLISSDQIADATEFLKRKIYEKTAKRPDQVARYQETLDMLSDKITDDSGNASITLSDDDARKLAELAKVGEIDKEILQKLGVSIEDFVNYNHVIKKALHGGINAVVISLVLKIGPEIYKAIEYLVETGEVSEEQFKDIGFAALTGASEGFIRGTLSAGIVTACNSGLWGGVVKNIDPYFVGAATVLAMNTMKNSYKVATNQMTSRELSNELIKELFVMSNSLISGGLVQGILPIPILGFMLGSFVGSVVGSFVYDAGYNALLSFCVDSGVTVFGLVDQNYEIPRDVLEYIGIDLLEFEKFDYERFQPEILCINKYEIERYNSKQLDIAFVKRGIIGVSQIGYV